jgi:hypothetical protein
MRRTRLADFVALYRGRTVAEAELVAVSAEEQMVRRFFAELLNDPAYQRERTNPERQRRVLEAIRDE